MRQYNLPDKRNDPAYSYWDEDYREYEALKNEYLNSEEDVVNYLMLLAGDDIDIMMYIRNKDIFRNKQVLLQLENLGVDTSGLDKNTDYILISRKGKEAVVLNDFTEDGKTEKTKKRKNINFKKYLRKIKRISQQELADMVGVSRNTISSLETGQYEPTAKLAYILAIALDMKFEDLFYF